MDLEYYGYSRADIAALEAESTPQEISFELWHEYADCFFLFVKWEQWWSFSEAGVMGADIQSLSHFLKFQGMKKKKKRKVYVDLVELRSGALAGWSQHIKDQRKR